MMNRHKKIKCDSLKVDDSGPDGVARVEKNRTGHAHCTSLGATEACPLVCAHMAYAEVIAPFQIVTAPKASRNPGCAIREEANLCYDRQAELHTSSSILLMATTTHHASRITRSETSETTQARDKIK